MRELLRHHIIFPRESQSEIREPCLLNSARSSVGVEDAQIALLRVCLPVRNVSSSRKRQRCWIQNGHHTPGMTRLIARVVIRRKSERTRQPGINGKLLLLAADRYGLNAGEVRPELPKIQHCSI